jgi:hypothetical protein
MRRAYRMGIVRILAGRIRWAHHRCVRSNTGSPSHVSGTWGSYERRLSGHGLVVEHLRVLPPNGTPEERLAWNAAVIWPTIGFFCGIAAAVVVHHAASVSGSVAFGAAVWLGPWVWLVWRSRPFARRVRESWQISGAGAWMTDASPLRDHAERLDEAGRWTAVTGSRAHLMLTWGDVYTALSPAPRRIPATLVKHMTAGRPAGS